MNDATRALTARARDRALRRLKALTVGTALAGFAATGAFGVLAAMNYSGHPTASTDTSGTSSSTSTDDAGTSSQSSATSAPLQAAQLPAVQSTRRAHVSTGGSG